jgi:hypothetical protein
MTAISRRRLALAGAAAALALSGAAALAAGSPDIANAPELPVRASVTGGAGRGWDFWRLTLKGGDRLVIQATSTMGFELEIFQPWLTDYTFEDKYDEADVTSWFVEEDEKREFRWTAPRPGRWLLGFSDNGSGEGTPFDYQLVAYVYHYTRAILTGPAAVRARGFATLRGKIAGLSAGKVAIQWRAKAGWRTLAFIPVKRDGSFVFRMRVRAPGTYQVRAVYFGDASHLPASDVFTFRVI